MDGFAVERWNFLPCLYRLFDAVDDESGDSLVDDFGDGTSAECDHGSSASHGFDHDEAERLRPVDGKEQGGCVAEEACLVRFANFADELNV